MSESTIRKQAKKLDMAFSKRDGKYAISFTDTDGQYKTQSLKSLKECIDFMGIAVCIRELKERVELQNKYLALDKLVKKLERKGYSYISDWDDRMPETYYIAPQGTRPPEVWAVNQYHTIDIYQLRPTTSRSPLEMLGEGKYMLTRSGGDMSL